MSVWQQIAQFAVNFLFPPHCPLCGKIVNNDGDWCPLCLDNALFVRRLELFPLSGVFVVGKYKGGLRKLLNRLKYKKQIGVMRKINTFLAAAQSELLPNIAALAANTVAVPVPLHRNREQERGFNQAEIIFGEFLNKAGIESQRLLVRHKETKPQFSLTPAERQQNLHEAFSPAENAADIRGKNILLLDDIVTTGATLKNCAAVLLRNGAAKVYALVLASDG